MRDVADYREVRIRLAGGGGVRHHAFNMNTLAIIRDVKYIDLPIDWPVSGTNEKTWKLLPPTRGSLAWTGAVATWSSQHGWSWDGRPEAERLH